MSARVNQSLHSFGNDSEFKSCWNLNCSLNLPKDRLLTVRRPNLSVVPFLSPTMGMCSLSLHLEQHSTPVSQKILWSPVLHLPHTCAEEAVVLPGKERACLGENQGVTHPVFLFPRICGQFSGEFYIFQGWQEIRLL